MLKKEAPDYVSVIALFSSWFAIENLIYSKV
jgi:hypothetical protein